MGHMHISIIFIMVANIFIDVSPFCVTLNLSSYAGKFLGYYSTIQTCCQ